jgi:hypothetical protein
MNGSTAEPWRSAGMARQDGLKLAPTQEASTESPLFVDNHDKGHLFYRSNLAFPGPHILHGNLRLPSPDRMKGPKFLSPCPWSASGNLSVLGTNELDHRLIERSSELPSITDGATGLEGEGEVLTADHL